jgi:hypothetical protein
VNITWIASYPKSGNTWVRFLLYHYLYGELPDTAALSRRIPDVHRREVEQLDRTQIGNGRLLVKTHFPLGPTLPYLANTSSAIYIVRHPKDVLLSMLNYIRLDHELSQLSDADYAKAFIGAGGDPLHLRFGFGTWEQNVFSWTGQRRIPLCFIRYRDLKDDAGKCLREMLTFLGEPIDNQRVARAVDLSTFERMRELEAREKSEGRTGTVFAGTKDSMVRGRMFMNKGETGQTLRHLGADIDTAFDRRFGSSLWMLGYGPTARTGS